MIVAAYCGVLILVLDHRPLWLDEILQLIGTRRMSFGELIRWVQIQPGAVPLGYMIQKGTLDLFGFSTFTARLPAATFGFLGLVAFTFLAIRLKVNARLTALILLAGLPIYTRYAVEARPYSQALFFSILSALMFIRLREAPTPRNVAMYALSAAGGLYSNPFTVFWAVGQCVCASYWARRDQIKRVSWYSFLGIAIAGGTFAPWFLYSAFHWRQSIVGSGFSFNFGQVSPLLIMKEISGAGYVGSLALLVAAVVALASRAVERDTKLFLLSGILPTVGGVIAADWLFGYFFSIRQVIFAIPPLVILSAEGLCQMNRQRWPQVARVVLLVSLAVSFSWNNVRVFTKQTENWGSAAHRLADAASTACIAVAPLPAPLPPLGWLELYAFFEPCLAKYACSAEYTGAGRIVLAITPYTRTASATTAVARLEKSGYRMIERITIGGSTLCFFELTLTDLPP